MATFTTWSALYSQMLDDLASGNWRVAGYSIQGQTVNYRSFSEFKEQIQWVKEQADAENCATVGRTYAAAKVDRTTGDWLLLTQKNVNEPITSSALVIRNRVLGPDGKPADGFNRQIEDAWKLWCDEADAGGRMHFNDTQRLLKREEEETGEQFVALKLLNEPGRFLPLALQVYEAEQLTTAAARPLSKDHELVGGVEVNKFTGRAVAYWFEDSQNWSKPIRVAAEDMLHDFEVIRTNQVRGVSAYAPAVLLARDLDNYIGAEVDAAKLASKFLVIVAMDFWKPVQACTLSTKICQLSTQFSAD